MSDKKYLVVGGSIANNPTLEEAVDQIVTSLTNKGEHVRFAATCQSSIEMSFIRLN